MYARHVPQPWSILVACHTGVDTHEPRYQSARSRRVDPDLFPARFVAWPSGGATEQS